MRIALSLRYFGPVASADISVRPLTIFIGPNGSGKSYTAMALYAFITGLVKAECGRTLYAPCSVGSWVGCLGW